MSLSVKTQGGSGNFQASIFVTGLSETDTVIATNGKKTKKGVWAEGVADVKIPTMTSDTDPRGKATASTSDPEGAPYQAFTGLGSYGWIPTDADSYENAYVQYEFLNPIVPSVVSIANIKGGTSVSFTYKVVASLDLQSWDTLVESFTSVTQDVFHDISVETEKQYRYFRLVLLSSTGYSVANSHGHKMQIFGTECVYGHKIERIREPGTWTVTATNGTRTTTQDVFVDAAVEYEIEMSYVLWLYREGNEYTDLTGGFSLIEDVGTLTRNEDNLTFFCTQSSTSAFGTENLIERNGAKSMIVAIELSGGSVNVGVSATKARFPDEWNNAVITSSGQTGDVEIMFDENTPDEFYVCLGCGTGKGVYSFAVSEIKLKL